MQVFDDHFQAESGWNSFCITFLYISFVKQVKEIYQYRNTREKLYKTNPAIWYNKGMQRKSSILTLLGSGHQKPA